MFYLYAALGMQIGALSNLRVIHIATHNSITEGRDGPTDQPVELDSLFQAMPNLEYTRPPDEEEVSGAWMCALSVSDNPSMISPAQDPASVRIAATNRVKVAQDGYTVLEKENVAVTLVSCGSELQFAYQAALELEKLDIATRVVSMPCVSPLEQQPMCCPKFRI